MCSGRQRRDGTSQCKHEHLRHLIALQAGVFDRVLLDVPCSGSGVLAKRADLRWRREPSDLAEMTALQVDCFSLWCHSISSCNSWRTWPTNSATGGSSVVACTREGRRPGLCVHLHHPTVLC